MNKEGYRSEAENVVRRLGILPTYRGYRYLLEGVSLALEDPERLTFVTKGIYLEIARNHQCTAGGVERSIRTVIDVVWERESNQLREVIGYPFSDKPSVSELLGSIVGYLSAEKNIR